MPLKSSISQVTFPSPATVVPAVVRLLRDLVTDAIGGDVKSDSTGMIDIEALVSLTMMTGYKNGIRTD